MTITFGCPGCKEQYQVDGAYAGRKWRCTKCSTTFVIPTPHEAPARGPAADGYRLAPGARAAAPGEEALTPGWETYRSALRVLNSGVLFALLAFLVFIGAYLLLPFFVKDITPGLDKTIRIALPLAEDLAFIAIVVLFVGAGLSCAVPAKSGVRGWTILSNLLASLAVATWIGANYSILIKGEFPFPPPNAPGNLARQFAAPDSDFLWTKILTWTSLGLLVLSHFFFVFSVSRLAAYFRRTGLGIMTILYMLFFVLFIGGTVFLIASWNYLDVLFNGVGILPKERQTIFFGWLGAAGLLTIWFMLLVSSTRRGIPQRQSPPG